MEVPYLLTPLYRYSFLNRCGMDDVPTRPSRNDTRAGTVQSRGGSRLSVDGGRRMQETNGEMVNGQGFKSIRRKEQKKGCVQLDCALCYTSGEIEHVL